MRSERISGRGVGVIILAGINMEACVNVKGSALRKNNWEGCGCYYY